MNLQVRWGPWLAGAAFLAPLVLGADLFRPSPGVPPGIPNGTEQAPPTEPRLTTDSIALLSARRAPFRVDGHAAAVAYDPARVDLPGQPERPPRPALNVTGVIDGRSPLALIQGIPGRDGPMVLAPGDTAGGLHLVRIEDGRVTISGMDTTWVLTLRSE